MAEEKKQVHAARMLTDKGGRIWVLFDAEHTLRGKPNESRKALLSRRVKAHGKPDVLVRIKGVCRPSELAMQMGDLKHPSRQRSCSWCHEVNDLTSGPTTCKKCGHRADLARLDCDCQQCRTPHPVSEAASEEGN